LSLELKGSLFPSFAQAFGGKTVSVAEIQQHCQKL
jgi:hypothetical protein